MNTKLSGAHISTLLFELGLALRLNKITAEDLANTIPVNKIKKLVEEIEAKEYSSWDDSHISSGDRLRSALEIHGLSQAKLAKELNVRPQKINDLINNRITLTSSWAKKIAGVLNVSYKVFV